MSVGEIASLLTAGVGAASALFAGIAGLTTQARSMRAIKLLAETHELDGLSETTKKSLEKAMSNHASKLAYVSNGAPPWVRVLGSILLMIAGIAGAVASKLIWDNLVTLMGSGAGYAQFLWASYIAVFAGILSAIGVVLGAFLFTRVFKKNDADGAGSGAASGAASGAGSGS